MTRKLKVIHAVTAIKINCSEHGDYEIPIEECSFSGGETECTSCGSHGSVDVSVTCPGCRANLPAKNFYKANVSIELNSW